MVVFLGKKRQILEYIYKSNHSGTVYLIGGDSVAHASCVNTSLRVIVKTQSNVCGVAGEAYVNKVVPGVKGKTTTARSNNELKRRTLTPPLSRSWIIPRDLVKLICSSNTTSRHLHIDRRRNISQKQ
jgi:hypothetical protein